LVNDFETTFAELGDDAGSKEAIYETWGDFEIRFKTQGAGK
jgi:hypothetical protein